MNSQNQETRRFALVTTTINIPEALCGYLEHWQNFGQGSLDVIVVGDRKSPPETEAWLRRQAWGSATWLYMDPVSQREWLKRFPHLDRMLPWDSVQRRNIGYLVAVERGAEVIITVDDDNFAAAENFFAGHAIVGRSVTVREVSSSSRWFNAGTLLQSDTAVPVTHRGFPQSRRNEKHKLEEMERSVHVAVNAGLWLGEPDVDAVSRIVTPCQVVGWAEPYKGPLAPAAGTFSPFNSQNTAFVAAATPCMYLVVMGDIYRGFTVGRYDDIWMSYFAKLVLDRMGKSVTYGLPWVEQRRNAHDLLEDLALEVPGMLLTEQLVPVLMETQLTGTTYGECYLELAEILRRASASGRRHAGESQAFWQSVADEMTTWTACCRELGLH